MAEVPKRFRREPAMERDRLLAAYLARTGISQTEFFRMSAEEADETRERADVSGILIPRTEPGYLYHGTSSRRASRIRSEGLVPGKRSGWARSGFELHVRGRVFFCDTVTKALFYATEASSASPAILRIPESSLPDAEIDVMDSEGCIFVSREVPPIGVEIWTRSGWKTLREPEPEEGMEP